MTEVNFWLYEKIGRALAAAEISAAENNRPVTEEELDARIDSSAYSLTGQAWCQTHQGQLHLLANAAVKAGKLSQNELQYGLEHIRRVAPSILAPLASDPGGAYLLSYIAGPTGEGNREQFRTIFLGSLIRIATAE